jgi:hypothetical protein
MYQPSGLFASLTLAEICRLDTEMWQAQNAMRDAYDGDRWYRSGPAADIGDIRRDLNAEWGNR